MTNKIAVFIYESVSGDLSRVFRAISTAKEFKAAGDDVRIIFDGSGVESAAAISHEGHPLHGLYAAVKPSIDGVCGFCASHPSHNVAAEVTAAGLAMLVDNNGEASVRKYVTAGYTILNF